MSIVKTLVSLLRNHNSRSSLRFHSSTHSSLSSPPPSLPSPAFFVPPIPLFLPRLASPRSRLFFPISGWNSFSGPLFLLRPAWKLSPSATPLYLRGRETVFPKDLFRGSVFPVGFGSSSAGVIRDGGEWKIRVEAGRDSFNENFFNLPNSISIGRMVSGPVISWMILNEWYLYAFCGLAVSGATDWLDGFVARKMNINSVIGSYLDPLADKILIVCVAVAMVKMDLLNPGLVVIVVLRDVALVGGAVFTRASSLGWERGFLVPSWRGHIIFVLGRQWNEECPRRLTPIDDAHSEKVEPLLISKINTVFQLLLVAAALLQPELGTEEMKSYVTYLSWLVASTTTASFAAYIRQYVRRRSALA